MILLYSSKTDSTSARIAKELESRKIFFKYFCPSDFIKSASLTYRMDGADDEDWFSCKGLQDEIDFRKISVVFVRRPDDIVFPEKIRDEGILNAIQSDYKNCFRETLEMLDCPWFPSKLSHIYTLEEDKFKELAIAKNIGLRIPRTILTTDIENALEFYRKLNGRVISKRYKKADITYKKTRVAFPTSPVSLRDIGFISHIRNSPTLFQEYVPKKKELRVTIVGNATVAAEIDSQKTHRTRHDWRHYDLKRTTYKHHVLPNEIHEKLILLVERLGLHYATVDFVITPDDDYIFLEINPSGQYEWLENKIGQNITGLICDKLIYLSQSYTNQIT